MVFGEFIRSASCDVFNTGAGFWCLADHLDRMWLSMIDKVISLILARTILGQAKSCISRSIRK
jgi:hypothetical protein